MTYPLCGPARAKCILDTASDLVGQLMYYDRKEDNELPVGSIQEAIEEGELTVDDIINEFSTELRKAVG